MSIARAGMNCLWCYQAAQATEDSVSNPPFLRTIYQSQAMQALEHILDSPGNKKQKAEGRKFLPLCVMCDQKEPLIYNGGYKETR